MRPSKADESFLGALAKARIDGVREEDALITKYALPASELLRQVIRKGLREMERDRAFEDRLRLKVLRLDPGHYARIEQEVARRDQSPAALAYARRRARLDAQHEEALDRCRRSAAEATKTIETALAFYETWKLTGGKQLGDATREDLVAEGARERATAEGHAKNAAFYEQLAARLTPGQRVADGVPIVDALRLRESVYQQ